MNEARTLKELNWKLREAGFPEMEKDLWDILFDFLEEAYTEGYDAGARESGKDDGYDT